MKCPDCGSNSTTKVWITDEDHKIGQQRCLSCGYKDNWLKFMGRDNNVEQEGDEGVRNR